MTDLNKIAFTNEMKFCVLIGVLPILIGISWWLIFVPWGLMVAYFMNKQFFSVQYLDAKDRVVYITGCDSGFGQSVAVELDAQGAYVFAGCLNPSGEGAECLQAQASERLQIVDLDVTDDNKVKAAAEKIEQFISDNHLPGLWALYNNAGVAVGGDIELFPIEDYLRAADINLWGTVRVTKSVLPLIRRTKGRIVTVTSGIARSVAAARSGYCIPKSGLEAFMDCLRYEMMKFGVKCCTINPGNLTAHTSIFDNLGESYDKSMAKVDPKLKAEYGEAYIQSVRDSMCKTYKNASSGSTIRIEEMVSCVKDAILNESPRVRYKPAQMSWIGWWFVHNLFSEEITDKLVEHWMKGATIKPKCAH